MTVVSRSRFRSWDAIWAGLTAGKVMDEVSEAGLPGAGAEVMVREMEAGEWCVVRRGIGHKKVGL